MNTAVLISTFLAASIEVIEMVAIVVAVGATRQWRGAGAGRDAGGTSRLGRPDRRTGDGAAAGAVVADPSRRGRAPAHIRLAVGTQRRPERLPRRLDDRHRRATGRGGRRRRLRLDGVPPRV